GFVMVIYGLLHSFDEGNKWNGAASMRRGVMKIYPSCSFSVDVPPIIVELEVPHALEELGESPK
ncbi:hypothetical protein KI387_040664, partial [Taxus chinensis]